MVLLCARSEPVGHGHDANQNFAGCQPITHSQYCQKSFFTPELAVRVHGLGDAIGERHQHVARPHFKARLLVGTLRQETDDGPTSFQTFEDRRTVIRCMPNHYQRVVTRSDVG